MAQCDHCKDPYPHGRPTLSLEAEALFLVGVLRAWTAGQNPDRRAVLDWRQVSVLADLPEAVATAFGYFMAIVMHGMRRSLDIRYRSCPQIGQDEEALLRIVGSLQNADQLGALDELMDWPAPACRILALRIASKIMPVSCPLDSQPNA